MTCIEMLAAMPTQDVQTFAVSNVSEEAREFGGLDICADTIRGLSQFHTATCTHKCYIIKQFDRNFTKLTGARHRSCVQVLWDALRRGHGIGTVALLSMVDSKHIGLLAVRECRFPLSFESELVFMFVIISLFFVWNCGLGRRWIW